MQSSPPPPPRWLPPTAISPGVQVREEAYFCDCPQCGSIPSPVSKRTFDRHRGARHTPDSQLIAYGARDTGAPIPGPLHTARSIVPTHGMHAPPVQLNVNEAYTICPSSDLRFPGAQYAARAPNFNQHEGTDCGDATAICSAPCIWFCSTDSTAPSADERSVPGPSIHARSPRSATQQAASPGRLDTFSPPPPNSPSRFPGGGPLVHGIEDDAEDGKSSSGESNPVDEDEEPEVGYTEGQGARADAHRREFYRTQQYINELSTATLAGSGLDDDTLARLRSARKSIPPMTRGQRAGVRMFLARGDASEANYTDVRAAMLEYVQDTPARTDPIPTYEQVKKLIGELTGITTIQTDMCPNTCVAYTGPFATLLACPKCGETRYEPVALDRDKRIPRRTFLTFPLGPQLQAMWANPESARAMRHRLTETDRIIRLLRDSNDGGIDQSISLPVFDDIYFGKDYLDAFQSGRIGRDDMVVMFSIDGAQLYASKQSDCWFYIWVLLDLSPTLRYKKRYVLPGGVIGGPNKPRNLDSFLFPGLYHLAGLQTEGLQIWDSVDRRTFQSKVFLPLATADSPAMAYLNGLVGHNGALGCRVYCGQPGRHKPYHPTYYPALKRPTNDPGARRDITLSVNRADASQRAAAQYQENLEKVRNARSNRDYSEARLKTGIAKPSIFCGLPGFLGMPGGFALDLMHLISLNLTDLIVSLLRGTLSCEHPDDKSTWDFAIFSDPQVWKAHGHVVAEATRYLPGSFDRPPRDPSKKISSGYKAWEFLLYVYGLLPGLLRHLLPPLYYRHFCRLVFGVRIVLQYRLPRVSLPPAQKQLLAYVTEYEDIYYQRRLERLHFVRPSLHTLAHVVPEAYRVGPGALHTQWTMENYIGNITREIKQHVTPYANVAERALRRCQVNALKAIFPEFDEPETLPQHARDLGDGYVLLTAADATERSVSVPEGEAILEFLREQRVQLENPHWQPIVRRWARLQLPTGQIARCAWKECALEARGRQPRRARMVKLANNCFAEVQYFFRMHLHDHAETLAMVSVFSAPDPAILEYSRSTLLACTYRGEASRMVVFAKQIVSVIAMVPLPLTPAEECDPRASELYGQRFFVVEKPGLDVALMAGRTEDSHVDSDGLD
uniref:Zn(2)-C6 fungal-type domain-containing protein n=1 Tax=Ganoderma boninense TaxID=34458 RepID=A0A5K1K2Y8_9APHY|nr:Zn(2)-C6 fungal-type domain-containing protein [Ganoderma boninense]